MGATVIVTEVRRQYVGDNNVFVDTVAEVRRCDISEASAGGAVCWARTYRKAGEGFVILIEGVVVGCEVPSNFQQAPAYRLGAIREAP
jgi:hypothetical protein